VANNQERSKKHLQRQEQHAQLDESRNGHYVNEKYRKSEPTKVGFVTKFGLGTPGFKPPNNFSACFTKASWSTPPAAART
jgi:hypothetical protein